MAKSGYLSMPAKIYFLETRQAVNCGSKIPTQPRLSLFVCAFYVRTSCVNNYYGQFNRSYERQYLASLFCQSTDVIIKIPCQTCANFTGNIDQPCCCDELVVAIFRMIRNNITPRVKRCDESNENWQEPVRAFFLLFKYPFFPVEKICPKICSAVQTTQDGFARFVRVAATRWPFSWH